MENKQIACLLNKLRLRSGRDAIERIYADIFHTDSAGKAHHRQRHPCAGNHASGVLRPGMSYILHRRPHDTLEEVIGLRGSGNALFATTEYHTSSGPAP
ncbi:MAG: methionine gamma-lyase family protein [Anaerovoracaceae bacterium]